MKLRFVLLFMLVVIFGATRARAQSIVQGAWADGQYWCNANTCGGPTSGPAPILLAANTAAGDMMIVDTMCQTASYACNSQIPTDSEGNTYTLLATCLATNGSAVRQWIYIAYNIVGGTTGNIVVANTATNYGPTNAFAIEITAANAVDQVDNPCNTGAILSGGTGTTSSHQITTTQPYTLVLGLGSTGGADSQNFTALGAGFTNNPGFAPGTQIAEYKTCVALCTVTATATAGSGSFESWTFAAISVYQNSGPPPPAPNYSLNVWSTGYWDNEFGNAASLTNFPWSTLNYILMAGQQSNSDGTLSLYGNFSTDASNLLTAAHANGVKVLFEVGAQNSSCCISQSDPAILAGNIKAIVDSYGFDGASIDYEEGLEGFTSPLPTLFADLDTQLHGENKLLVAFEAEGLAWQGDGSIPIPACAPSGQGWSLSLVNHLDALLVGNYDEGNPGVGPGNNPYSWFNSPLASDPNQFLNSLDNAVKSLQDCGISNSKLIDALPFYGDVYTGNNAPRQTMTGSPTLTQEGYGYIADNIGDSGYTYDSTAHVPWKVVSSGTYQGVNCASNPCYVAYENPRSIGDKISYVVSNGLLGTGIWNLGWDSPTASEPFPLLNAIGSAYVSYIPTVTSGTSAIGNVGTPFSYTITGTSPLAITGYTASSLPAGLTLNASTGVISGTPTAVGLTSLTIGISNQVGNATSPLAITIVDPSSTKSIGYYAYNNPLGVGYPAVSTMPWASFTHVVATSSTVNSGGTTVTDPPTFAATIPGLVTAAHANSVKVMYGVGDTGNITIAGAATLAANIVATMNTNNMDGVDFDYEPSNWTSTGSTAIATLLQDLQADLNGAPLWIDVNFSLIATWGSGPNPVCVANTAGWSNTQFQYVNLVNLEIYDLEKQGSGNPFSWVNSPLYSPPGQYLWSADYILQAAKGCSGLTASKLGLLFPWYGYIYIGQNGPYKGGAGALSMQRQLGYASILANFSVQNANYDKPTETYWMNISNTSGCLAFFNSGQCSSAYLSWNGPYSILQDVRFAETSGVGAFGFWAVGSDYNSSFAPYTNALAGAVILGNCTNDPLAFCNVPVQDTHPGDYQATVSLDTDMAKNLQGGTLSTSAKWLITQPIAPNEWAHFQVCEQPTSTVGSWSVAVSSFTSGSNTIASSAAEIYGERWYQVNSGYTSDNDPFNLTGEIPDPLVPSVDPYFGQTTNILPASVTGGNVQCAMIRMLIPSGQAAGFYSGTVTVKHSGSTYQAMPVTVPVSAWTMPATSSLISLMSSDRSAPCYGYYNTGCGGTPVSQGNMLQTMMAMMLDYRQSCIECILATNNGASNNWTSFDALWGALLSNSVSSTTGSLPVLHGAKASAVAYNLGSPPGTQADIENWSAHFTSQGYPLLFEKLCDEGVCDYRCNPMTNVCCDPSDMGCQFYGNPTGGVNYVVNFAPIFNNCSTPQGTSPIMPVNATRGIASGNTGGYTNCVNIFTPNDYTLDPCPTSYGGSCPGGGNNRSTYNTWLNSFNPLGVHIFGMYTACNSFQFQQNNCNNGDGGGTAPYWCGNAIDANTVRNRCQQWVEFINSATADLYYEMPYCWYNNDCGDGHSTGSGTCGTISPWTCRYYSGVQGDGDYIYPCNFAEVGTGSSSAWTPFPCPGFNLVLKADGYQDYEKMHALAAISTPLGTYAMNVASLVVTTAYNIDENRATTEYGAYLLSMALHENNIAPAPPLLRGIRVASGITIRPGVTIR